MKGPLESPVMAGFVARLDEINALADRSPGFVWRLQTGEGNATYLRPYDDDRILFNLSVWESIERLREYVYRTAHVEVLRNRHEWFSKFEASYLALWWVPVGHRPSVDEAKKRLAYLADNGPTSFAFSFKVTFPRLYCCSGYRLVRIRAMPRGMIRRPLPSNFRTQRLALRRR